MSMYMKGFNQGYILAKDLPKIFEQYMTIGNHESEYGKGFGDGAMLGQRIRMKQEMDQRKQNRGRDEGLEL